MERTRSFPSWKPSPKKDGPHDRGMGWGARGGARTAGVETGPRVRGVERGARSGARAAGVRDGPRGSDAALSSLFSPVAGKGSAEARDGGGCGAYTRARMLAGGRGGCGAHTPVAMAGAPVVLTGDAPSAAPFERRRFGRGGTKRREQGRFGWQTNGSHCRLKWSFHSSV
ncbi:unnamed protein product [Miscanthus lutarioriparius]|uniref:Uncharacterized protein n=1 Tax=Miscanthus lutarioriparius TaxID=422564 RepID=A0A811N564_9POAL|nr:unnamed protein product [Miscanthus lutarioriparius]